MVRLSKWIEGTRPEQPVEAVAQRAIRERLKAVRYYAPLAAYKPEEDTEYVHQLRVSTRRAQAALQIFADLLPRREMRRMKQTLRGLRRAAGDARDLDVLVNRLTQIAARKKGSKLGTVIARIERRRQKAQKPLIDRYEKAKKKGFKERTRNLVKSIGSEEEQADPTFAAAARTTLAPLVADFFVAAEADLSDTRALHQMRIAGKRVRYAMELLAGAFDERFREELYPIFEEVQEKLGKINDHATAITMFIEWFERAGRQNCRAELAELAAFEEKALEETCEQFRGWWTAERAAALKRRFDGALEAPPPIAAEDLNESTAGESPAGETAAEEVTMRP
jgi:CHAD domain-containing protein